MSNFKADIDHYIGLILLILTLVFLALGVSSIAFSMKTPEKTGSYELSEASLIAVQGNSLVAITPHYYPKPAVMGMMTDLSLTELAEIIIMCESGGRPNVCNQQYGCKGGMGLFQLIPSTVKYCEGKLGKTIDPFNPDDNYECGMWLLENEGTSHWGDATTWWGSYSCWSKEL